MTNKWDKRFMTMAWLVSTWSKDPSSRIGAVAVNDKRQILATGYNGFPRNIKDTDKRLNDRELKYKLVVHAEKNCIYNATFNGVSLQDTTMYIYGLPVCNECAKGIIQVGVERVVYAPKTYTPQEWLDKFEITKSMFKEAKVKIEEYKKGP